jgi:periplasmic divalent cation tolerance protein
MKLVIVSCSPGEAASLLDALLSERLVGCGNILPTVRSHYWWQGELCRDEESLLLMETEDDRISALMQRIPALHSYDVPKIVALEITDALPAYAGWLRGVLAGS